MHISFVLTRFVNAGHTLASATDSKAIIFEHFIKEVSLYVYYKQQNPSKLIILLLILIIITIIVTKKSKLPNIDSLALQAQSNSPVC